MFYVEATRRNVISADFSDKHGVKRHEQWAVHARAHKKE
jgi:hypothetical protein